MPDRPQVDPATVWAVVREALLPVVGWLLVVAGGVALTVGWFGVSREALVAKQVPYLVSGGLGGLALVVVGAVLIGAHDVRRVGQRLHGIEDAVGDLHGVLLTEPGTASPDRHGQADPPPGQLVALPVGERYHAADCPIVTGKDGLRTVTAAQARDRGLAACKVCVPDQPGP